MNPRRAAIGAILAGLVVMEVGVYLYNRALGRELWSEATDKDKADGPSTVSE